MTRARSLVLVCVAACSGGKGASKPVGGDAAAPAPAPDAAAAAPSSELPAAFAKSLADTHMEFAIPAGFKPVAPVDNPHWQYAFAMESPDGSVEIRFRIDPLAGDLAEHDRCVHTPGCAGADPNRKWSTWLFAIAANISGAAASGALPQVKPFDPSAARNEFRADAGAVAVLDTIDPGFHARQHHAYAMIIHKDDVADAVVVILADELAKLGKGSEQLDLLVGNLRFAP